MTEEGDVLLGEVDAEGLFVGDGDTVNGETVEAGEVVVMTLACTSSVGTTVRAFLLPSPLLTYTPIATPTHTSAKSPVDRSVMRSHRGQFLNLSAILTYHPRWLPGAFRDRAPVKGTWIFSRHDYRRFRLSLRPRSHSELFLPSGPSKARDMATPMEPNLFQSVE